MFGGQQRPGQRQLQRQLPLQGFRTARGPWAICVTGYTSQEKSAATAVRQRLETTSGSRTSSGESTCQSVTLGALQDRLVVEEQPDAGEGNKCQLAAVWRDSCSARTKRTGGWLEWNRNPEKSLVGRVEDTARTPIFFVPDRGSV